MSDEKFCVRCKHCIIYPDRHDLSKCGHAEATKSEPNPDYLVSGQGARISQLFCTSMRQSKCGPEGKLWEPM